MISNQLPSHSYWTRARVWSFACQHCETEIVTSMHGLLPWVKKRLSLNLNCMLVLTKNPIGLERSKKLEYLYRKSSCQIFCEKTGEKGEEKMPQPVILDMKPHLWIPFSELFLKQVLSYLGHFINGHLITSAVSIP